MLDSEEGWTLVTQRKPRKKQVSRPQPDSLKRKQHEQNTYQHLKKKGKRKFERKLVIV